MHEFVERAERFIRFKVKSVKRSSGKVNIVLAEFYSLPFAEDPDVISECSKDELLTVLTEIGEKDKYNAEEKGIKIYSDDLFEKLVVYACVRQTIRKVEKVLELRSILKSLGLFETHFWAATFIERFRERSNRKSLYRPAKAFKILYGLVVK